MLRVDSIMRRDSLLDLDDRRSFYYYCVGIEVCYGRHNSTSQTSLVCQSAFDLFPADRKFVVVVVVGVVVHRIRFEKTK